METMECQHHGNCGGWCETDEEREMCLCFDCLDAYHDDEERQKHVVELEKAMQRIACAAGFELAQPKEIADAVCARLISSLAPPNA